MLLISVVGAPVWFFKVIVGLGIGLFWFVFFTTATTVVG